MTLRLVVELEKESDGRWIADVVTMPGVMVYGETPKAAFRSAQALALDVISDRLKHGEDPLTGRTRASAPALKLEFRSVREAVGR